MHRPRYTVSLFQYVYGTFGFDVTRTVRRRTAGGARLAAKVLLARHPVRTTNARFHEDVARGAFAEIARGPSVETVSAPVHVEPSVGERGVW